MDATVSGLLLATIFIVPGFMHYTISKATRVWDTEQASENAVLFTSLGFSGVLVAVEGLVLGVATLLIDAVQRRVEEGFSVGAIGYGHERPAELLIGLSAIFLINTGLLSIVAARDPAGTWLEKRLRARRVTSQGALYHACRPDGEAPPPAGNASRNRVLVYLNGEATPRYSGWVGAADVRPDSQGERFLQLWNADRWCGDAWVATRLDPHYLSCVLLKFSLISAVEFTYVGRDYSPSSTAQNAAALPSFASTRSGLVARLRAAL